MADFTDESVFLNYLSSFWTRVFSDSGAIQGLLGYDAHALAQQYQDFLENIQALSINTINPLHRELITPLVLKKSTLLNGPDVLKFGDGAVWGPQPDGTDFLEGATFEYGGLAQRSGLYYTVAPTNLKNIKGVIVNRLIEPSVVLMRDSDFILKDGLIILKNNPFENPLIPRRIIPGSNGETDEELVLWIIDGMIDRQDLYRSFGYVLSEDKTSTEQYRQIIASVFRTYTNGPTREVLDGLVATLAGAPVAREATETVERIDTFGSNILVVTDAAVYKIPTGSNLRPGIAPGTILSAGQPLTTITEIFDRSDTARWWFDLPALDLGSNWLALDISRISIPNQMVPVQLETVEGDEDHRHATFMLGGSERDLKIFWDSVRQKSLSSGQFLGDLLWVDSKLSHNGAPDFTLPLEINPLDFMITRVMREGLVAIKLKISQIDTALSALRYLKILRDVMPAQCGLLILINVEVEDSYGFLRDSGEAPAVPLNLVGSADLVRGRVANFTGVTNAFWTAVDAAGVPTTKTPEALSAADTVDIIRETLDLSSIVEEQVSWKMEEIPCKP